MSKTIEQLQEARLRTFTSQARALNNGYKSVAKAYGRRLNRINKELKELTQKENQNDRF